jgi:oxaloacetate decarboxylase alpha subunit
VLDGGEAITCRPADNIAPELDELEASLTQLAAEKSLRLADELIDDVLTYALFPQIGFKFIENRDNPDAFEPAPSDPKKPIQASAVEPFVGDASTYAVQVDGKVYQVAVSDSGEVTGIAQGELSTPTNSASHSAAQTPALQQNHTEIKAPLSGNIFKVIVNEGQMIEEGDVIIILEAMKMETEVRSTVSGTVAGIQVSEGDAVQVGHVMMLVG